MGSGIRFVKTDFLILLSLIIFSCTKEKEQAPDPVAYTNIVCQGLDTDEIYPIKDQLTRVYDDGVVSRIYYNSSPSPNMVAEIVFDSDIGKDHLSRALIKESSGDYIWEE